MTSSSRPISTSTLTSACAWPHADRLIFLRICEDRGIESYAYLQSLLNGERVCARLLKHFRDAADGSQLSAYSLRLSDSDSGRSAVSRWPLARIIGNLYYPDSPYEFSVMPADVLGQVYEQFLGKVIRLTAGHQAKVEEKPEVRKAGGEACPPALDLAARRGYIDSVNAR